MKKEHFFSKLINNFLGGDKKERTKEIEKLFDIDIGEELTKLYCKCDVLSLADVIENFVELPFEEYGNNPLFCVNQPGYTYRCASKYTDNKLQTLQDKELILA